MCGRSSGGDEAEEGVHPDADEGSAAQAEVDEEREPAAIAPSVRATIESDEQSGLPNITTKDNGVVFTIEQDGEGNDPAHPAARSLRHGSDENDSDDSYAAVNDMSDSSGSEAGALAGAEQDILQDAMDDLLHHPRIKDYHFDNAFEIRETFDNDRLSEPDFTGISSVAGDYTDYQEWEGFPNTPVDASTPQLGHATVPSLRRVHFELQASYREASEQVENDATDSGSKPDTTKSAETTLRGEGDQGHAEETSEQGADDSCSGSGYESGSLGQVLISAMITNYLLL